MSTITSKKISFLKEYIDKNFPFWHLAYGDNLVGAHPGYKEVSLKTIQRYCIVFHVRKKFKNPKTKIPDSFEIDFPNLGVINIPTDVIEVGALELHSALGSDVKQKFGNYGFGTVGFYGKRYGHFYACSNMHVLGSKHIKQGKTSYYLHVINQKVKDIKFNPTVTGYLEEAYFDNIDAAIVRIHPRHVDNRVEGVGKLTGFVLINMHNLNYYRSKLIRVKGATRNQTVKTRVIDIGINKYLKKYNQRVYLTDLIRLKKCTRRGDSGGPVFVSNTKELIGIIVGADDRYSYAIPAAKILHRFHLEFLT